MPDLDYRQAIEALLAYADFERSGRFADRPDVAPVLALLSRLGDPHLGRVTVHITGSKGKGSVAAMVESVLRQAGLRTGLYTSPHLDSYCERVRIDGQPISEEEFSRHAADVLAAAEAVMPSLPGRQLVTFDLLTAIGFLAFRQHRVQVQVVEVGLGGRVDSTNVFPRKEASVITPISLEHTAILGDTPAAIAREKAAIVRPPGPLVLAPQGYAEAKEVCLQAAAAAGVETVDVAVRYRWRVLERDIDGQRFRLEWEGGSLEARLPLLGTHQVENAATAVAVAHSLARQGLPVDGEAIARGLAKVAWPGRLEVLSRDPLVVADGAHNGDSARRLRQALEEHFAAQGVVLVVGTLADKDIVGMARELAPIAAAVIAAPFDHPRAMPADRVASAFAEAGCTVYQARSAEDALGRALAISGGRALICLTGSLAFVAEGRRPLLAKRAR
ncbi:MAG: bifunctional folylpolyglutamate synthase/dihydrofolate synthase [Dehalococcoidia bacterium]|jgi:dihydrofolate synthase/folylpolyglutamate synthase|nr:bifunctional folylpolyglutamate synthase/dihydrofolate synthase [Dehalococcoidia bacterium]MDW8009181.1 folylpolyglutamate synthase/dihydrofolate synthase family protein [Chloroflexota bacterium]